MTRSRVTVPVLVVLATLVAPPSWPLAARPAAASAGTSADPPPDDQSRGSVQVSGTGDASGEPDMLTADFAVEADASTVGEALNRATTAATRMRDSLIRSGAVKADLRTSSVDINPKRNDHNDITGYTVRQGLTAKIHHLPQAGTLMSAAIAAGGDVARLNGVAFSIEDDAALLAEARKKAFADAQRKATLYARAAGRSLGPVARMVEETPSYGRPFAQNDMAGGGAGAGSALSIEPGRQQVTVTVTVEWALTPAPAGQVVGGGSLRT